MPLLNWRKRAEYEEADEFLVRRYQAGMFLAKLTTIKILGDIYQKYDENGNKTPKQEHVVLSATKQERNNWGALHRALVRLTRAGYVISYKLHSDGRLAVNWFSVYEESKKRNKPGVVLKEHGTSLQPSTITKEERDDEVQKIKSYPIWKDTAIAVHHHDIVWPKDVAFKMQRETHRQLHYGTSVNPAIFLEIKEGINLEENYKLLKEAQNQISEERARINNAEIEGAGSAWGRKYKHNPDYFNGAVSADIRPFMTKWIELTLLKGSCTWPSPVFKSI